MGILIASLFYVALGFLIGYFLNFSWCVGISAIVGIWLIKVVFIDVPRGGHDHLAYEIIDKLFVLTTILFLLALWGAYFYTTGSFSFDTLGEILRSPLR